VARVFIQRAFQRCHGNYGRPRCCPHRGISDRKLTVNCVGVDTGKAFDKAKLFVSSKNNEWKSATPSVNLGNKICSLYDQTVSFPVAARVSEPLLHSW